MIINEEQAREMGYVCTECGKVAIAFKQCPKGCTKICEECLKATGHKFVFCKKCGDMTLK